MLCHASLILMRTQCFCTMHTSSNAIILNIFLNLLGKMWRKMYSKRILNEKKKPKTKCTLKSKAKCLNYWNEWKNCLSPVTMCCKLMRFGACQAKSVRRSHKQQRKRRRNTHSPKVNKIRSLFFDVLCLCLFYSLWRSLIFTHDIYTTKWIHLNKRWDNTLHLAPIFGIYYLLSMSAAVLLQHSTDDHSEPVEICSDNRQNECCCCWCYSVYFVPALTTHSIHIRFSEFKTRNIYNIIVVDAVKVNRILFLTPIQRNAFVKLAFAHVCKCANAYRFSRNVRLCAIVYKYRWLVWHLPPVRTLYSRW